VPSSSVSNAPEHKQRRPDLPVMMVTAYGDDKRRRQATEYGALQFLAKPVDFNLLKHELHRLSTTPM
jgi:DNA-binding NtrC family response regulator